jgi:hypothetical protein
MVDAVAEWSNATSLHGVFATLNIAGSNPVRVFFLQQQMCFSMHPYLGMVDPRNRKGVRYERCRVLQESAR